MVAYERIKIDMSAPALNSFHSVGRNLFFPPDIISFSRDKVTIVSNYEIFPTTDAFYWGQNFIRNITLTRHYAAAAQRPMKVGNIVVALRRITV